MLSNENDFQRNCTEIIRKCVAENVKNVVVSNNEKILYPESIEQYSGVMTRRKAAALAISDSFQNEKVTISLSFTCANRRRKRKIYVLLAMFEIMLN